MIATVMPNAADELTRLKRNDVILFIISRHAKGAKCFNGDWWGGSRVGVVGSPTGYDAHVVISHGRERFIAEVYALKNIDDVDLSHPLLDPFILPFYVDIIFDKSAQGYGFQIYDADGVLIMEEGGYNREVDVHRIASEKCIELMGEGGL